jgi:hypothetical protein
MPSLSSVTDSVVLYLLVLFTIERITGGFSRGAKVAASTRKAVRLGSRLVLPYAAPAPLPEGFMTSKVLFLANEQGSEQPTHSDGTLPPHIAVVHE